ncbi:MAG: hypothetical protein M3Y21_12020 [Candidatus Eremiobacteraeota bacterium]|nr:hypothetical protein [Candidatus Eremiobacteraeota bacterium]
MRPAATVMLLRPAGDHFEVFMLRRSALSAFAPDVYVFPGGVVESQDRSEQAAARTRGIEASRLERQFRAQAAPGLDMPIASTSHREAAACVVAGLRELYEEAGVLLACDAAAASLRLHELEPHVARLSQARSAVATGELPFADLLSELGIFGNGGALHLFSRWITPPSEVRRYDAHFFIASAEAEQAALADAHETHDGIWIAPQTALDRSQAGDFRMVYPTIKHIERLARFTSVGDALDFTAEKHIYTIMPNVDAQTSFAIPTELEYAW